MASLEEPLSDGDGGEGEHEGKRLVEDETAETGKVGSLCKVRARSCI